MTFKELAEQMGILWEPTLARFSGNEALLRRFLLKFPNDTTFAGLKQAVEAGDLETAEKAAHTLKGLSANLGLDRLSGWCAEYVADLRSGEHGRLAQDYQKISQEYQRLLECFQNWNES